jgi:hypothetical protein
VVVVELMPNWIANLVNPHRFSGASASVDSATGVDYIIRQKPSSIVVLRGATTLSAQTVRLDMVHNSMDIYTPDNAATSIMRCLVLGYLNHPTITDTNLQRGDRFYSSEFKTMFDVIEVQPVYPDRLQAVAQARVN